MKSHKDMYQRSLLQNSVDFWTTNIIFRFCKPEVEQPITTQNPYPASQRQPVILFMEPIDHIIIIGQAHHMFSRFLNLRISIFFHEIFFVLLFYITSLIQKNDALICIEHLGSWQKCLEFTKPKSSDINKREWRYKIKGPLILK